MYNLLWSEIGIGWLSSYATNERNRCFVGYKRFSVWWQEKGRKQDDHDGGHQEGNLQKIKIDNYKIAKSISYSSL